MGQKDFDQKAYLSDSRRYADLYNAAFFEGEQFLKAEEMELTESVTAHVGSDGTVEKISDIVMRQKRTGELFALWILENQETMDYSIPVRVMLKEAMEYERQVKRLRSDNSRLSGKKSSAGEFLYKVKKSDHICPVVTLILYWGKQKWDGPRSLHDFIDFSAMDETEKEKLKKFVPEYPLHILDLNVKDDYKEFSTELRTVFELYARRNNKEKFREYIVNNKECRHLDSETVQFIGRITKSAELLQGEIGMKEEGDIDMCRAITEMIEEGRTEGRTELILKMLKKGISCEEVSDIAEVSIEQIKQLEASLR